IINVENIQGCAIVEHDRNVFINSDDGIRHAVNEAGEAFVLNALSGCRRSEFCKLERHSDFNYVMKRFYPKSADSPAWFYGHWPPPGALTPSPAKSQDRAA